jgi:hypothetical protein
MQDQTSPMHPTLNSLFRLVFTTIQTKPINPIQGLPNITAIRGGPYHIIVICYAPYCTQCNILTRHGALCASPSSQLIIIVFVFPAVFAITTELIVVVAVIDKYINLEPRLQELQGYFAQVQVTLLLRII